MPADTPPPPAAARRLLQQAGLEMAFIDRSAAGGGEAATVLAGLLAELESACVPAPEPIRGLIATARDRTARAAAGPPAEVGSCRLARRLACVDGGGRHGMGARPVVAAAARGGRGRARGGVSAGPRGRIGGHFAGRGAAVSARRGRAARG